MACKPKDGSGKPKPKKQLHDIVGAYGPQKNDYLGIYQEVYPEPG